MADLLDPLRATLPEPPLHVLGERLTEGAIYAAPAATTAAEGVEATSTAIAPYYPANNGFLGSTAEQVLQPGAVIDRYGGSAVSRLFSPAGTPAAARALPPGVDALGLRTFQVLRPLPVQAGTVAPAFGQLGFGTQFMTGAPLETLLNEGFLLEVLLP